MSSSTTVAAVVVGGPFVLTVAAIVIVPAMLARRSAAAAASSAISWASLLHVVPISVTSVLDYLRDVLVAAVMVHGEGEQRVLGWIALGFVAALFNIPGGGRRAEPAYPLRVIAHDVRSFHPVQVSSASPSCPRG